MASKGFVVMASEGLVSVGKAPRQPASKGLGPAGTEEVAVASAAEAAPKGLGPSATEEVAVASAARQAPQEAGARGQGPASPEAEEGVDVEREAGAVSDKGKIPSAGDEPSHR